MDKDIRIKMDNGLENPKTASIASLSENEMTKSEVSVRIYSIKEASKVMGVAVNAVRTWIRQDRLRTISCGVKYMIPHSELERFICSEMSETFDN